MASPDGSLSRLLDLPPELRNLIYSFIFTASGAVEVSAKRRDVKQRMLVSHARNPGRLPVNQQIRPNAGRGVTDRKRVLVSYIHEPGILCINRHIRQEAISTFYRDSTFDSRFANRMATWLSKLSDTRVATLSDVRITEYHISSHSTTVPDAWRRAAEDRIRKFAKAHGRGLPRANVVSIPVYVNGEVALVTAREEGERVDAGIGR